MAQYKTALFWEENNDLSEALLWYEKVEEERPWLVSDKIERLYEQK